MAALITAVIGHRGSGKTEFLRRAHEELTKSGQPAVFVDIDHEIERAEGSPIVELFPRIGEKEFRRLERATATGWFERLQSRRQPAFVSLGAGFDGEIPADVHVLWIRRRTDGRGRIFLDRPALNPGLGPLDEYRKRYSQRDQRFRLLADETLLVEEGSLDPTEADRLILGLDAPDVGGCLTVLPENLRDRTWASFLEKRLKWGIELFEIRDDLIDSTMCARAGDIPPEKRLVSYRRPGSTMLDPLADAETRTDWALEVGSAPNPETTIVSVHRRGPDETMGDVARRLVAAASPGSHLKLAVPVRSFAELRQGHGWWLEDTKHRSFLPRSTDGRWAWYRQIQRGRMKLNFLREGDGSSLDQPTLSDWVTTPRGGARFSAILGAPVDHSRTPSEHESFFGQHGMSTVRIAMTPDECSAENLEILARLGLTHAAVTSPLKKAMYELCSDVFGPAKDLRSVNTVMRRDHRWIGTNTDLAGLQALIDDVPEGRDVAIWGGGGTRAALMQALPRAVPYSARTGEPLDPRGGVPKHWPEIVIWAVGRNRQPACRWPPEHWRPLQVLDLNYSEDSPGLEYAWRLGASYTSGLEMFRVQAERQREFWRDHGGK